MLNTNNIGFNEKPKLNIEGDVSDTVVETTREFSDSIDSILSTDWESFEKEISLMVNEWTTGNWSRRSKDRRRKHNARNIWAEYSSDPELTITKKRAVLKVLQRYLWTTFASSSKEIKY